MGRVRLLKALGVMLADLSDEGRGHNMSGEKIGYGWRRMGLSDGLVAFEKRVLCWIWFLRLWRTWLT